MRTVHAGPAFRSAEMSDPAIERGAARGAPYNSVGAPPPGEALPHRWEPSPGGAAAGRRRGWAGKGRPAGAPPGDGPNRAKKFAPARPPRPRGEMISTINP